MKKKLYLAVFLCIVASPAFNQSEISMPPVPLMRQLIHDNIDQAQKTILRLTGSKEGIFAATNDIDVNLQLTQFLKVRVNNMQARVELDSTIDDNSKYKWLRGIYDMLQGFISAYRLKAVKGILLGNLIMAYEEAVHLEMDHQPITPVIDKNELEVGEILINNPAFQDNAGLEDSKNLLVLKTCERYPDNIMQIVGKNMDVPFADSLIIAEAHHNPEEIYDYASANNALGRKIKLLQEPLVKAITQMAAMPTGRIYFPFLDEIYHNKITIDSISKVKDDDEAYFKLLVKTEIDYAGRMHKGDTPYVKQVLTERLRMKAVEYYIDEINALHEEKSDAVRFKITDNLTPQELYYLCVLGEDDIYTSSYIGVYDRIFSRMQAPRSDTLLNRVQYDYYKKFIRMAAAYNELDDFLKRMDKDDAEQLMKHFVDGLEKTKTLEDAVDVADSYASINDAAIRKLMINQVQYRLKENKETGNKRGEDIYRLLKTIFLSMDPANKINVSAALGIIPVYEMPERLLKDASGSIIIQQFFYGDKDGKNIFNSFLANFNNGYWKVVYKPEWVEVKSIRGTPIVIYANRPLDAKKDLDDQAQQALCNYLDSLAIEPTVVIHRGHSYYVKSTIKRLFPSAKVILLGSCGGYNSLNDVLKICPQSHIISSKQVGTGAVNIALIDAITETLRQGKDLNWPAMWKGLESKFKGGYKEKFDDYVPPHKNLGAMFIMAYHIAEGEKG